MSGALEVKRIQKGMNHVTEHEQ